MSQTRRPATRGLQGHGALPDKMIYLKKKRVDKAHNRDPVMCSLRSVPKNTKYTPGKRDQERPEKTEGSLQQKT